MDGREGMTLQGSTPYYLHRAPHQGQSGHFTAPQQGQIGHLSVPPLSSGYRPPNPNFRPEFNVQGGPGPHTNDRPPPQEFSVTVGSTGGEPIKKKRGRPRKYGPDGNVGPGSNSGSGSGLGTGNVSLRLSPSSPNSERKKRGRPPGSGRKQRLASVGEWMNKSAGAAFMPHVIHVQPGEDIAEKILLFSQQRSRALCIMSGCGGVSAVSLRQHGSTAGTVTFEGRFEILCLSGSYLVAETGGPCNRAGGVTVSLSSSDGHVIGGAVGGRLVASRPVQVVVCSFVYGNDKGKSKESDEKVENNSEQPVTDDKTSVHVIASPSQNVVGSWPGPRAVDSKNPNTDFDLADG